MTSPFDPSLSLSARPDRHHGLKTLDEYIAAVIRADCDNASAPLPVPGGNAMFPDQGKGARDDFQRFVNPP